MSETKRYSVRATIHIDGELTVDELRAIFTPIERVGGRLSITNGEPKEEPPTRDVTEEEERKAKFKERVRALIEAYRARLGDPIPELETGTMGNWLNKYGEELIRAGMDKTVAAAIRGRDARYEYLADFLYSERRRRLRDEEGPGP